VFERGAQLRMLPGQWYFNSSSKASVLMDFTALSLSVGNPGEGAGECGMSTTRSRARQVIGTTARR